MAAAPRSMAATTSPGAQRWHGQPRYTRQPCDGPTCYYEDGVGPGLAHKQLLERVLVQLDQAAPTAGKRLQTRDLQFQGGDVGVGSGSGAGTAQQQGGGTTEVQLLVLKHVETHPRVISIGRASPDRANEQEGN